MKQLLNSLFGLLLSVSCLSQKVEIKFDWVVAQDGSGDFTTVQAALDAVPHLRKNRTYILVKPGRYHEKLLLAATKTNVSLIGQDVAATVLTYDDYASKPNVFGEEIGTSGSASFFVNGEGFRAENITFENASGPVGQAVAVRVDGDQVQFTNCRFLGFQDTLYPHGQESRQYYKNCYIEGTVDFIFGWSTAVFEGCEIRCKGNGYITAASTDENTPYGFVFINCRITGDGPEASVYLGRPWRPYARTVFLHCELPAIIDPQGWHNWGSEEKEQKAYYAEYKNSGPGYLPDERVKWAHVLTPEEARDYTVEHIFGDWVPEGEIHP